MLDGPHLGNIAHAGKMTRDFIVNACRRARRVLREKRQDEYSLATQVLQSGKNLGDRGPAVAHGILDRYRRARPSAQKAKQQLRLFLGVDPQRRTFRRPDARVFPSRSGRADVEDDAVEHGKPRQAGKFDDSRVREKLRQIAPHGSARRRLRGAEIDEQNRGLCSRAVAKRRFGKVAAQCWDSALESSFAVMSTMGMTRS